MIPSVACTRLVCVVCKAEVRARVGYYLPLDFDDKSVVPARARLLHASDDWLAIEGVEAKPDYRLYTCTCFYHSSFDSAFTFTIDDEDRIRWNLPWMCGGHPPAELPLQVEGGTIDDLPTLTKLIDAAIHDSAQGAWVRDLFHRTHHGALEGLVPECVARAAARPGPMGHALTALCASETRLAPLKAFAEEVLRCQAKLGAADPARRREIAEVLTQVVWQRPAGIEETGTISLLRVEALEGVLSVAMLTMFSIHDREWMVANLGALMAVRGDLAGATLAYGGEAKLWNHPDPAAAIAELATVARTSGVPAEVLRSQATEGLGSAMLFPNSRGPILEVLERMATG